MQGVTREFRSRGMTDPAAGNRRWEKEPRPPASGRIERIEKSLRSTSRLQFLGKQGRRAPSLAIPKSWCREPNIDR